MTSHNSPAIVWTIAGTDSGGGAGIGADVKACEALDVHACTVVAAVTAQHSTAVERIETTSPALLDAQLAALESDMPPTVIKTGMLGSAANARVVANWVRRWRAIRPRQPVLLVVDPVMRASTGAKLASQDLIDALRSELVPLADVVTPNRVEAAALLGWIGARQDGAFARRAAQALVELGCRAVVVTGGDASNGHEDVFSNDYMVTPQNQGWLTLPRIGTHHNHGTGCVFASTVAAALARGFCEADAIVLAKMGTTHALKRGYAAGAGAGPVRPGPGAAGHVSLLPGLGGAGPMPELPSAPFATLSHAQLDIYAVVDSAEWVERVLLAGARTVQLRIKQAQHPRLRDEIVQSIELARAAGAQLFINDHWALAIELGAYGVHLGQEDLATADLRAIQSAGLRLGLSTHSYWEICRAWHLRPSYIACGPIHATDSKAMPWVPQGAANLAYWSQLLPLPVVGIGGMDVARVQEARRCQASGAALISAITQAPDVAAAHDHLQAAWQRGASESTIQAPDLPRSTLAASRIAEASSLT